MNPNSAAFTLIELLIALGIFAILAIIAYPSYQDYISRSHRYEAELVLMRLATHLEQYHTLNNTYEGATLEKLKIPEFTSQKRYRIAISQLTSSKFLISAIPLSQLEKNNKACGNLSLNDRGERFISGNRLLQNCWKL